MLQQLLETPVDHVSSNNTIKERIVACHTHTTLLPVVINPSIVHVELLSSHLPCAILELGKTLSHHLSLLKVHPAQACIGICMATSYSCC